MHLSGSRSHVPSILRSRSLQEHGQATAEYAVVILVGIAFAMAVFLLITGGALNGALGGMLKNVLAFAQTLIH